MTDVSRRMRGSIRLPLLIFSSRASLTNPARPFWTPGCLSFSTALASICRTRSRVTLKIDPTSSSV